MCARDYFQGGSRPRYVCDRGLWPHNELHLGDRGSLLVLVDESGERCEVELLRSWSLLLFAISRTYADDRNVPEQHRGVRASSTLGAFYRDLLPTFSSISPPAVRTYVYKIRCAVDEELERARESGRTLEPPELIDTVGRHAYRIGVRGLDVYCNAPLLPVLPLPESL